MAAENAQAGSYSLSQKKANRLLSYSASGAEKRSTGVQIVYYITTLQVAKVICKIRLQPFLNYGLLHTLASHAGKTAQYVRRSVTGKEGPLGSHNTWMHAHLASSVVDDLVRVNVAHAEVR